MMLFSVNKKEIKLQVDDPDIPLLWVLRDHLNLTGTKYGCGIGACGACTVLIDGIARPSCMISARDVQGKEVTTIEGLSPNSNHPVQKAWVKLQVPQCGYCQSGQILSAVSLLNKVKDPDNDTIKETMSAVLCRCGTYPRIVEAIKLAAREMRE
ncbi:MAG: (2Fe-2S)-binding protein [Gammaproteobacteria bacterium]|nr:(2Fe-2S)-binding protein [Gammaproteobacteria bacterium]